MKKLLGLVFALMIAFTLVGCEEAKTIIEKEIELVEVERIVIQTVTEKLSDEQLENIRIIVRDELFTEFNEKNELAINKEMNKLREDYEQLVDELEPEIIYETVIKTETEYVDRVEYKTNTVYVDVVEFVEVEVENTDMIDFLLASLLDIAEDAKALQVHMGVDEEVVYASYQEYFNAMAGQYTELENIVTDETKPVLGEVTLTNDEFDNLVLTVNASDNVGLKSLEVDHNVVTIPEFTIYTEDILASEETFGASMVYTEGLWTVNFGEMMSNEIRNNTTITFYFVIKDLANNTSGSMYYVQPEMTVVLDVPEIPVV